MLPNMINLSKFEILDMKESEYDYRFLLKSNTPPPSHCPKCGAFPNFYKHGKKDQLFFDLPMHGKRVGLIIKRQRYRCLECKETFFEDLPDMDVSRSVTNRLIDWIQQASLEKTFTSIAEEIGGDEKTVRNIFNDYVAELEAQTERLPSRHQTATIGYESEERILKTFEVGVIPASLTPSAK